MKIKNFLLTCIICTLLFFLVGCGCEKEKEKEKVPEKTQIEKTIEKLYTDDKKLVYDNNGIYKLVFYHNDKEITGLEHYYEYKNEKEAKAQYEKDKENLKNNASIKNITLSGKYVIYTMSGEQYEGKTVEEVKKSYSYLIPVYED